MLTELNALGNASPSQLHTANKRVEQAMPSCRTSIKGKTGRQQTSSPSSVQIFTSTLLPRVSILMRNIRQPSLFAGIPAASCNRPCLTGTGVPSLNAGKTSSCSPLISIAPWICHLYQRNVRRLSRLQQQTHILFAGRRSAILRCPRKRLCV